MRTNVFGLRLRSAVHSRRRRLVRSTIGVVLLLLLCLLYPGVRKLTAQLLAFATAPSVAADVATDEPATAAAKKSPRHLFNPLANDARLAAGLILPSVPPEPEYSAYASEQEPLVIDLDDAVGDEFRDVEPASMADAISGDGGWWGGRRGMVPSIGAAAGGFGGGSAGVAPEAVTATNETSTGDERAGLLSDHATKAFDSSATTASTNDTVGGPNGENETLAGSASHGSTPSTGGPAGRAASALAAAAPADIAPAAMVIAELTSPPQARSDSSSGGAPATPVTAGIAADAPGALADVPEPATLLIFGLGLAAVAYRIQRRRA